MILHTDRLTLRPLRPADAADVAHHANEIEVARWLLQLPHPYTLDDAETFIGSQLASASDGATFAICRDDRVMGCIGTKGEFGYWLGQEHWGQGYVTEAALAVLVHHFEDGGGDLNSSHATGNTRSARVLEKCGFIYTGAEQRRVGVAAEQDHIHREMVLTQAAWEARG